MSWKQLAGKGTWLGTATAAVVAAGSTGRIVTAPAAGDRAGARDGSAGMGQQRSGVLLRRTYGHTAGR